MTATGWGTLNEEAAYGKLPFDRFALVTFSAMLCRLQEPRYGRMNATNKPHFTT
jgi:hypothetical protein